MLIDTYIDRVHLSHLSSPIRTSSLDPKRKQTESGMDCQIREHLDFKLSKIKNGFCLALATSCLALFW